MSAKKYRKVRVDIFQHDKTRQLSAVAKLLMIYLTTPHYSGIFEKSIAQMRTGIDVSLPTSTVRAALDELVSAGLVQWDEEYEVVWLVEGFDEQVCASAERHPNVAKGVMAHLDTLPPSSVVRAFLKRYGAWLRRSGIQLSGDPPALRVIEPEVAEDDAPAETPDDPLADPLPNPSRNPSRNPCGDPFFDPLGEPGSREQVTESREQVVVVGEPHRSLSRQARAIDDDNDDNAKPDDRGRASPADEYLAVEKAIARAFEEAMALAVGPGAYRWAIERWQAGDATLDEILRVVDWWRNNRATADCQLRECFMRHGNGARWSRVEALALGRSPVPRNAGLGGGGRGGGRQPQSRSKPGIDDTWAAWDAHEAKRRHGTT